MPPSYVPDGRRAADQILSALRDSIVFVIDRPNPSMAPGVGFQRPDIEAHLDRILKSPAFASSQRAKDFLIYVTQKALDGEPHPLNERTVANELFRLPNYDPAVDSFVRGKAGDVRKRLAKYYESPPSEDFIRFDIPLGVYVPKLAALDPPRPVEDQPRVEPAVATTAKRRMWAYVALAVVFAASALAWSFKLSNGSAQSSMVQHFWQPLLEGNRPILISLPSPPSYMLYGSTLSDLVAGNLHPTRELGPHLSLFEVPNAQLVRQNIFFGIGEAQALAKMAVALDHMNKPSVTKASMDVSSSDLHNQNAVLLGGFSSRWALRVAQDLAFRLEYSSEQPSVIEINGSRRSWKSAGWLPGGRDGVDYAIVARLKDWSMSQAILILAGTQTFGTQAAMEFTLSPELLTEMARLAPKDWRTKNIEVVIETKVVEGVPSPGRIVASRFW